MSKMKMWFFKHMELCFWITAIVLLFFLNTERAADSFCFFRWIGINWCPGCGIGHSMHAVLNFQFYKAFQYHPLGIVAVLIIFHRMTQLVIHTKQPES